MNAPRLDTLQLAWLHELGIDRQMLVHYMADAEPFGRGPAVSQAASGATPEAGAPEHARGRGDAQGGRSGNRPGDPADSWQRAGMAPAGGAAEALAARDAAFAALKRGGGAAKAPAAPSGVSQPPPAVHDIPHDWEALQASIAVCKACDLHHGRSQAVFGAGMAHSPDWLVVGEAPGDYDDREGVPFQGKAGILLQAMLASIDIPPESPVFFTNLVKCRPLGNRPPSPEEIAACMPYLQRQIALLKPGRILALGRVAAQSVLGAQAELDDLRGTVHMFDSETGDQIPVIVTHHPASLLMRPQHKADVWQDLNLARSLA